MPALLSPLEEEEVLLSVCVIIMIKSVMPESFPVLLGKLQNSYAYIPTILQVALILAVVVHLERTRR
jgi:hypothetical protein